MIKKYIFEKIIFETIIIPKGTILFRGLSYNKHSKVSYLFNDFIIKFSINSVFDRPELNKYKYIRNTIKNKTRRNLKEKHNFMMYGLDYNNSNISSVSNITNTLTNLPVNRTSTHFS